MSRLTREFSNRFQYSNVDGIQILGDNGKVTGEIENDIRKGVDRMLKIMYDGLESYTSDVDYTVYTGTSGISLLHLHLHTVLTDGSDEKYLQTSLKYLQEPLMHLKKRRVSFLCGDAGPLSLGAVIYHKLKQDKESKECINLLEELQKSVCIETELPNELLYGRVGYIYSLLFVQKHLGKESVNSSIIPKILKVIIESGRQLALKEACPCPLMFTWHDKHYLGAAHGIVGIIHILLQLNKEYTEPYLADIQACIDYLMTLQLSTGNYPSSLENQTNDKLVHWCHGAPGWIHMLIKAYQIFDDRKYLLKAKQCSDVIWLRGLLKKGYGLCHGAAGNGYGFLTMYKATHEEKYIYQAYMFATWCLDYGKHGCNISDRPYSLFEGIAGTVYFLTDLLSPLESRFPAFDI